MAVNLRPVPGLAIIEPDTSRKETKSGIILPESAKEAPIKGTIVAIGALLKDNNGNDIPFPCKEKDRVIYKRWEVNEIKVGDKKYVFAKFNDILAIIT